MSESKMVNCSSLSPFTIDHSPEHINKLFYATQQYPRKKKSIH
ncbi:MAG: hypothetical protein JWP81_3416 [Ferruginibacter sp.]|nr:hypothetical protein [Ferruginibacter sp.]